MARTLSSISISILRARGNSARFELYWPLAVSDVVSDVEGAPADPGASVGGRGEEILLVEDEHDLRDALSRILTDDGYSVTVARKGEEALEIISRRERGFDLVVTDIVMPGMNGFELAERVEATHPNGRVLLISGHLNDGALGQVQSDMPLLAKPFAAAELIAQVRGLLDPAG